MGRITFAEAAGMYSKAHFIYLAILFTLIILGVILVNKKFKNKIREVTLVIIIIITFLEIFKIGYTHYVDHIVNHLERSNTERWIPLSFCSLFIYSAWLSIIKNKVIHKIGASFLVSGCLFAGLSFLIYPSTALGDWPWWHFYSIHGMLYHSAMLFTGLINLLYGDIKPTIKNFKYYLIFTIPLYILALVLSYAMDMNLMFLRNPYALPKIVDDIYNYSKVLYTFFIITGYTMLYFISMLIYKIYIRIKERAKRK